MTGWICVFFDHRMRRVAMPRDWKQRASWAQAHECDRCGIIVIGGKDASRFPFRIRLLDKIRWYPQ